MTLDQIMSFAVIGAMMALFVWGRFRYDLVAAARFWSRSQSE